MKALKKSLPVILMILFEAVLGVLLIIDWKQFTTVLFIAFGSVLMLAAVVMLIRYLQARKKQEANQMTIAAAVLFFIFGALFAFGSGAIVGASTALIVIFYGAVLIVNGCFKIGDFVTLKKEKAAVSKIRILAGIVAIVLGVVVIVNPFSTVDILATILGIMLIVEAVMDIVALLTARHLAKQNMFVAEAHGDFDDED